MAENQPPGDARTPRRRPSIPLLLGGILALLVSAWALIGPTAWPAHSIVPAGWIVVAVAVVVGIALVVTPRRNT
ncbi:MAG: hypothetical protein J2P18_18275 [Nocardia sp.]|nr:hypothetical protein [Nocardia sp.]